MSLRHAVSVAVAYLCRTREHGLNIVRFSRRGRSPQGTCLFPVCRGKFTFQRRGQRRHGFFRVFYKKGDVFFFRMVHMQTYGEAYRAAERGAEFFCQRVGGEVVPVTGSAEQTDVVRPALRRGNGKRYGPHMRSFSAAYGNEKIRPCRAAEDLHSVPSVSGKEGTEAVHCTPPFMKTWG